MTITNYNKYPTELSCGHVAVYVNSRPCRDDTVLCRECRVGVKVVCGPKRTKSDEVNKPYGKPGRPRKQR